VTKLDGIELIPGLKTNIPQKKIVSRTHNNHQ